jgi:hypothetical protein
MKRIGVRWMVAAIVGVALAYAFSQPSVQRFIENSGVNIPTDNVVRDYAWGIAWAGILLVAILAWPIRWEHKKLLAVGWLARCCVALVVMLPYEEHYPGADCWNYFQQAHFGLAELAPRMMNGGSDLVIWLGALHLAIGPDSYHAMKLSFAFAGLAGVYLFYLAAELLLGRSAPWAFWALLLYPSILFWSTILGKDPLMLAAIGLNVWGVVNVAVRRRNAYLAAVLAGAAAASAIRIWMGPMLILPCIVVLIFSLQSPAKRLIAVLLVGLALAALAPAAAERLRLDSAADLLETTRTLTGGWDRANSSLKLDVELDSTWDLVLFTPQSVFIAFFRPLPGDVLNVFGWLAGCENLGLLTLSIAALFRFRLRYFRNPLFLWGTGLVMTWGLFYSVVAYKDLGSVVRYKLQVLPIMLSLIVCILRRPAREAAAIRQRRRAGLPVAHPSVS